jgi:hypothetical protein
MDELQEQISALDEAGLNKVGAFIKETLTARVEERIAQLPEYPWVVAGEGSREWRTENHQHELRKVPGVPFQVRKEVAAELLRANGSYRLATAEELGQ